MATVPYSEYINTWVRYEVYQGKAMITLGVLAVIAGLLILRSEHTLLKGSLGPLVLLIVILVGYGSYVVTSRPAHARASIQSYEQNEASAIESEKEKHINDNKAGKTLTKIYPILLLLSVVALMLVRSPYQKGVALGCILLFASVYVIDYGFISRSDRFLDYLGSI